MADSNKISNKETSPLSFNINSNDRRKLPYIEHMLMKMEIDRVFQKYRQMSLPLLPVITIQDIQMKLMMDEEIDRIKMKYRALMSESNEAPNLLIDNDVEMASALADEEPQRDRCPRRLTKCRKKLNF